MKELFDISTTDECRLWECHMKSNYALLSNLDLALFNVKIYEKVITSLIMRAMTTYCTP